MTSTDVYTEKVGLQHHGWKSNHKAHTHT